MAKIDMDAQATAFWMTIPASEIVAHPGWHGEERKFESVKRAVRFCVEDLDPSFRYSAWIATDRDTLHAEEIEAVYQSIL